jgi:hypothetical protein
MNLEQAIRAGAARVDRRGVGEYVRIDTDGAVEACVIGAAYLGCHPDVEPAQVLPIMINSWLRGVMDETWEERYWWWHARTLELIRANDGDRDGNFDELLDAARSTVGAEALEVEVCNNGTGDE